MDNKPLTAQDRCDRCGAQAQARTSHTAGPLLWCAHHFRKSADILTSLLVWQTPEIVKTTKTPAHT